MIRTLHTVSSVHNAASSTFNRLTKQFARLFPQGMLHHLQHLRSCLVLPCSDGIPMAPRRCIDPFPGNIIMSIMSIVSLMSIMYIIHIMLPADQPGYHRRMSEFDEPFHLHTLRCEHVWSYLSISQGHFSSNHEKVSYSWLHHIHTPGWASCSFSRHKWGTRQRESSFQAFVFQTHEGSEGTLQQ